MLKGKTSQKMLEVLVPPGDVPGISQGMPEPLLLWGDLFPQQLDTPGGQKRHHDGHGQTHRRVGGHLGTGGGTWRQARPREMDELARTCSLTEASVEKR